MHRTLTERCRACLRPVVVGISLAGLSLAAHAQAQAGGPGSTMRSETLPNPLAPRPGQDSQYLIERKGETSDPEKMGRWELFTVQSLVFSFVDETKSGHFVRPLDDGLREASVEVVDKSKGSRRALLLRTKCADKTYFFDLTTRPVQPLKPVEPGTMIELLVNKACE